MEDDLEFDEAPAESSVACESILEFGKDNLHPTLLENITRRYSKFTKIQQEAIPVVLSGKDVLIKSQTGSGKTLAALIPVANYLYERMEEIVESEILALVVVPTNELVTQTISVLSSLFNNGQITVKAASDSETFIANVIVSKPKNAISYAKDHQKTLKKVVLDEADLLFEFGFKNETLQLAEVLRHFGRRKQFQTVLLSATLDKEVKHLAKLILYKPICVQTEFTPTMGSIKEFYINVEESDKLLFIYTLLKMEAVPHPTLVFTNSDQRAYKIKTLLGKFSIETRALSRLLSPRMRQTVLNTFNQGRIDVLIIADDDHGERLCATRGIDFKSVQCVLNFDAPADATVYTHRIGRTGRIGNVGSSITFICAEDAKLLEDLRRDESRNLQALHVDKKLLDPLRYRLDDVSKGVTKKLVATSQMQAVRQSALLEEAFVSKLNKHDEVLLKAVVRNDEKMLGIDKRHLAHLPKYLVSDTLKSTIVDLQQKVNVNVRPAKPRTEDTVPEKASTKVRRKKLTRKKTPKFRRKKK
ncbi:putative DEAD/DEAH box helicase [Babesia divergens]|uniref:RNA helicase n=1 Tax=Babesia divergens TaxID=32595 RepID=A0AAD9LGV8_BABDI|nr:putative DEAD/DEAH box helicase [Babesia divergens]